jgi:hypothetical protein
MSFPIQISVLYNIPLSDYNKIISMLTPVNIVSISILFVAAGLTFVLNKHIYKIIPPLLVILFANNAIVGLYGTDFTLIQVCLSFLLFALSLKPFYNQEIKAVIMNPKLRWWKTPKRHYTVNKAVDFSTADEHIKTEALNFSTSGLYAKVEDENQLNSIKLNTILDLDVGAEKMKLQAKVVRIIQDTSSFPNGIGLDFIKDEVHKNDFIPWLKNEIKNGV